MSHPFVELFIGDQTRGLVSETDRTAEWELVTELCCIDSSARRVGDCAQKRGCLAPEFNPKQVVPTSNSRNQINEREKRLLPDICGR